MRLQRQMYSVKKVTLLPTLAVVANIAGEEYSATWGKVQPGGVQVFVDQVFSKGYPMTKDEHLKLESDWYTLGLKLLVSLNGKDGIWENARPYGFPHGKAFMDSVRSELRRPVSRWSDHDRERMQSQLRREPAWQDSVDRPRLPSPEQLQRIDPEKHMFRTQNPVVGH
jgi:hypothetical protein